jgi:hypothetical protein
MKMGIFNSYVSLPEWYSIAGWWFQPTSGKYDFVSWDDEIPNFFGKKKHVPNHQSAIILNIIPGEAARHGLSVSSDRNPRAKQNKAHCHRSRMVPTAVNGELRLSPKMCSVYSPSPATHKDGTGRNRCGGQIRSSC